MDIIATTYWWAWPARNSLARSTHDGPWRKNNSSSSFFSIIKADKYKYNIDKYEIDILSNHETFLQSKKVSEAGSAVKQGGSSSHKEKTQVPHQTLHTMLLLKQWLMQRTIQKRHQHLIAMLLSAQKLAPMEEKLKSC
jgi:hypothetical protein